MVPGDLLDLGRRLGVPYIGCNLGCVLPGRVDEHELGADVVKGVLWDFRRAPHKNYAPYVGVGQACSPLSEQRHGVRSEVALPVVVGHCGDNDRTKRTDGRTADVSAIGNVADCDFGDTTIAGNCIWV